MEGLRVRTKPFVGEESHKLEPLLSKGVVLFLIDGPVSGSGYEWYLIEPVSPVDLQPRVTSGPAIGWVASASPGGVPWIVPYAVKCYDTPLGWLTHDLTDPLIRYSPLSCFGDRTLRFTAGLSSQSASGCRSTTGPWTIEPAWLRPCPDPVYRLADPDGAPTVHPPAFEVTLAPTVDVGSLPNLKADQWLLVDVVGQYAHPAGDLCRAWPTGGDGEAPPPPEMVVLDCHERFVVTSMTAHTDT